MKFLIYNGSLKPDAESNTFAVCKMLQLAFDKLGHECEIITLRDLDYNDVRPYELSYTDITSNKSNVIYNKYTKVIFDEKPNPYTLDM